MIGGCCLILICWLLIKWIKEKQKESEKKDRRKKRKNRIGREDDGASNEPIVIHANGEVDPSIYREGVSLNYDDGSGL